MPKITTNGLTMHYQQLGEGPDVVLIHGITGSLAMWYMNIGPALAKEYRVTMYDLRGHGYTDAPPTGYTTADMAEDLHGLLDEIGIAQAHFLGHSYGGAVALHLGALYPERVKGLILADSGVPALLSLRTLKDWPGWEEMGDRLAEHGLTPETDLNEIDPGEVIRKSFDVPVHYGLRKGKLRKSDRIKNLLDNTSVMKDFRNVCGLTEEKMGEIECPTMALYGANSIYREIGEHLKERMPHCATLALQGGGHFYLVEKPETLIEPTLRFLKDPLAVLSSIA